MSNGINYTIHRFGFQSTGELELTIVKHDVLGSHILKVLSHEDSLAIDEECRNRARGGFIVKEVLADIGKRYDPEVEKDG